ncbi:MAG: cation transporter [Saprospiraceae bacterium]|nr:cation transporter [Saprospiraceae bacterium]
MDVLTLQRWILIFSTAQFLFKLLAWYITGSLAIFTDATESIVNIIGAFMGLMALAFARRPKDKNHPYGHGKIEFLSASFEGMLIGITGLIIIFESISRIYHPAEVQKLDVGMIIILISGILNYLVGKYALDLGSQKYSLQLVASGKHLMADSYSTLALFAGLLTMYLTHLPILDNAIAAIFAVMLVYTSYKIIRDAIAGILDEADENLLNKVVAHLNHQRRENWVDLHNMRIIKYGSTLHFDCHLTVPWYFNVHESHAEVDALDKVVRSEFGESVELFVHTDGCLPFSCSICTKMECAHRIHPFKTRVLWDLDNISSNSKHGQLI